MQQSSPRMERIKCEMGLLNDAPPSSRTVVGWFCCVKDPMGEPVRGEEWLHRVV